MLSSIAGKLGLGYNVRTIAALTMLPLVAAGVYLLTTGIAGVPGLRYDPAYFSAEYVSRYNAPSAVIIDLERAIRSGDRQLMAELQGLRRPTTFPTSPHVRMTILYNVTDRYFSYLFWDTKTYDRFPYHVEQVGGRWVVAPEDGYYYFHSGRWLGTWLPLAELWWVFEATIVLMVGLYRLLIRWRRETMAY